MADWIYLHCCGKAGNNSQAHSRPAEPPGFCLNWPCSSSAVFTQRQQQFVPAVSTRSVPLLFLGLEISVLQEPEVLCQVVFHHAVPACGAGVQSGAAGRAAFRRDLSSCVTSSEPTKTPDTWVSGTSLLFF